MNEAGQMYARGNELGGIAKLLNLPVDKVQELITESAVERRKPKGKYIVLSESQQNEIIDRYKRGESLVSIARSVSLSKSSLYTRLREWGIKVRSSAEYWNNINHEAFSEESPVSLYLIGYLMTDGCIHDTLEGRPRVSLSSIDFEIVNRLGEFVGFGRPPYLLKGGRQWAVNFCSEQIVSVLGSYGVVPRKSRIAEVKKNSALYSRDFWRGAIDGDGSLGIRRDKKDRDRYIYPTMHLVSGSRKFIEQYVYFLEANGIKPNIIHEKYNLKLSKKPCFTHHTNGKQAVALADLLYSESAIYLPRKYDLAMEFQKIVFVGHSTPRKKRGPYRKRTGETK